MLTFESPFYELAGVVVFRDHASPTTFHYLSPSPQLRRNEDGSLQMLLLKYRHALETTSTSAVARQQLGGGFLMFGVDCRLSDDKRSAILRELESRVPPGSGAINLVPVLYTKGTVNVIALDQQRAVASPPDGDPVTHSQFIRGIVGTATPSLLHNQEAIFSLALTSDAATLIEEAYKSDMSPIGVMYELEFMGLRPALSVQAKIDYRRVYESFKMGLHVGVGISGGTSASAVPVTGTPAPTASPRPTATVSAAPVSATPVPAVSATPAVTTAPVTTPATSATPGASASPAPSATPAPATAAPGSPARPATTPVASAAPAPAPAAPAGQGGQAHKGTDVFLSADIGMTIESLKQQQAITITIVRQQEGQAVDEMEKNALALIKETILNDFFKPAMSNQPSPIAAATAAANSMMAPTAATSSGTAGGGSKVEVGFQLQWKKEEELKEATVDYSVTAPEKRTHAPNGFFSALVRGTDQAKVIRSIDLDDPFFKTLDVEVGTTLTVRAGDAPLNDFALYDLRNVLVEMQYGGTTERPERTATVEFKPDRTQAVHFLSPLKPDQFAYRHRATYNFGQSDRIAAQRPTSVTPWQSSTARALTVHPPNDVAMLHVYVEPGVIDWDLIEQIQTRLTYDDAPNGFHAERTFLIKKESPRQEWMVRLSDPSRTAYQVKHTWHFKDRVEVEGAPAAVDAAQLVVNDMFVDRLPITIQPLVDKNNVARVVVELLYQDPENHLDIRKNVELVGPDYRAASVTIPIMNAKRRAFTSRVLLIKTNGGSEQQPPRQTEQLSLLVTEGGVYLDVTVTMLGELASKKLDAIQIDLRSEPLEGDRQRIETHLFEPGGDKKVVKRLLLRADRPQRFEYRTTVFSTDLGPIEGDWTTHEIANLVLQVARLAPAQT